MPTIVPGMSEKELKSATQRNTLRNQVYLCAIDRQIVRVPGPRPPSPTSKITKTADREEEEKKAQRNARARRRRVDDTSSEAEEDTIPPIEYVHQAQGPGDEEEYNTPVRPPKRVKLDDGEAGAENKFVRWNRSLAIIRGGLGAHHSSPATPARSDAADGEAEAESSTCPRSALKPDAQVPLDAHGNVVDRPVEQLKRSKVLVQAVFYDGEEPVAFDYNVGSKPKKGKKK